MPQHSYNCCRGRNGRTILMKSERLIARVSIVLPSDQIHRFTRAHARTYTHTNSEKTLLQEGCGKDTRTSGARTVTSPARGPLRRVMRRPQTFCVRPRVGSGGRRNGKKGGYEGSGRAQALTDLLRISPHASVPRHCFLINARACALFLSFFLSFSLSLSLSFSHWLDTAKLFSRMHSHSCTPCVMHVR